MSKGKELNRHAITIFKILNLNCLDFNRFNEKSSKAANNSIKLKIKEVESLNIAIFIYCLYIKIKDNIA